MTTDTIAAIANEIKISELGEAIGIIRRTFETNSHFINLSGQWADLEIGYNEGRISDADFRIGRIRLRENLLFFVRKLNTENQATLLKALGKEPGEGSGGTAGELKISYIESVPKGAPLLQTGLEYKELEQAIGRGLFGKKYRLLPIVFSATMANLINALLRDTPEIIHFSGHAGKNGLVFSDRNNELAILSNQSLDLVFQTVQKVYGSAGRSIELIFLNACHSEEQVKSVSKYCNYSIGMRDVIPDDEAIVFAVHFYEFLANLSSPDIETCFRSALAVLNHTFKKDEEIPQLWKNGSRVEL
jgi:hypothetical protein